MIYMKTIKIMSIAVLALAMAACSNDTEQPAAVQASCPGGGIPFSATITTGSQTRALTENTTDHTLDAAWATGEKVALVYGETLDEVEVTKNDDGTATITGSLTGSPKQGDAVTVIYPASAVDATTKAVKTNLLSAQDGTLATIATSLDLRQSDGATLTVGAGHASLNGTVTLSNQLAIVKFSLSYGSNPLAAKTLTVKDGDNNTLTTVKPSEATSDLYVAMAPASEATFRLEASDGTFLYIYEKSGVTLTAGKYYQSPVTLDVVEETIDVSASGFSGTYDGQPHGISVTVNSPTGAVVKYGTTDGKYDLDTSPEYTDAGNYTVYYQVTKDKYTTVTGSAEVKIAKAAGSIRYGEDKVEKKVSDSPFKNETLTLIGSASVSYSSDKPAVATVAADGTVTILSTGTATITATVTSSTNYSYSPDYAQYTLTVKLPNSVGESGGYTNAGDPISNN